MTYRDDRSALEARHASLEKELHELRERMRDLAACAERTKALELELFEVRCLLLEMSGPERTPPKRSPLDDLRVASPCNFAWDGMKGDDRVRFCSGCEKNVYNLSAMARHEAEDLLRQNEGICVRLYRREDGTVLSADCSVGVRRKRRRRLAVITAGSSLMVAASAASLYQDREYCEPARSAVTGYVQAPPQQVERVERVLAIETVPATADVYVDGERMPPNLAEWRFPADGAIHRVTVDAPGYISRTTEVTLEQARTTLVIELEAESSSRGYRTMGVRAPRR